jgi:hypothetical protein
MEFNSNLVVVGLLRIHAVDGRSDMKNPAIAIALAIILASPVHAKTLQIRHTPMSINHLAPNGPYFGEDRTATEGKQWTSMLVGVARDAPADKIPNFDVTAACRALTAEPDATPDDRLGRGTQHCVDDERAAREQLAKQWSQFKPADRVMCVGGSSTGSVDPVYTELITCLEVARDAELLNARTTTPNVRSRNHSG